MQQSLEDWAKDQFGHAFSDDKRLVQAVTHPSLSHRNSYQRLEFLGDRVLGLVVAQQLLRHFPQEQEGVIARRFVTLVRKETLADVARKIGIPEQIRLEASAHAAGVHMQDGVCSDVMEALIAALYLDADLAAVDRFIERHWSTLLEADAGAVKDPKTRLQEWAQGRSLNLPRYTIVSRDGPDHAPIFQVEVTVDGYPPVRAQAGSKRDAEQGAATAIWEEAIAPSLKSGQ